MNYGQVNANCHTLYEQQQTYLVCIIQRVINKSWEKNYIPSLGKSVFMVKEATIKMVYYYFTDMLSANPHG